MSSTSLIIDLSAATASLSTSSDTTSSPSPARAALAPLHNHNYPSAASTLKMTSTKPSAHYLPYSKHQQQQIPHRKHFSASHPKLSMESAASTSTASTSAESLESLGLTRAEYLKQFDYCEMRCKTTRVDLGKKPHASELAVAFHSPNEPCVNYDTFFQTTHEFLDLPSALHIFPHFVDLPLKLRPSKARYDATKQNDDPMLRVRCLFCRGRFGGKNAKAIWERHVKEHWPKQDRSKESVKEEARRPVRHIQKRPTSSNAHSRTRSRDADAWNPNTRYLASSSSPFSSYSRSSSPTSDYDVPRVATPVCFPTGSSVSEGSDSHSNRSFSSSSGSEHEQDDDIEVISNGFPRSPRAAWRFPGFDELEEFGVWNFQSCGTWDVDAHLEELDQASKPCLTNNELQAALDAATGRYEEHSSPMKTCFFYKKRAGMPVVPDTPARKRLREEETLLNDTTCEALDKWLEAQSATPQHKRRRTVDSFCSDSSSSFGSSEDLLAATIPEDWCNDLE